MIHFFDYLIISTICLSICYGLYLLLFRKESGFVYMRAFLLASILLSLLIPLIPLSIEIGVLGRDLSRTGTVVESINSGAETSDVMSFQSAESMDDNPGGMEIGTLILWGYLLGVSVVFLWIFMQLFQITKLLISSQRKKFNGINFASSKKVQAPFSFFSWIFLPEEIAETKEANIILIHERIHVSELHSLDILLSNLLCAFMWFNPLTWRLRYSIQQLHEYLADEGTLSSGINRNDYMTLMLDQAAESRLIPLYSGFNRSLLKNRMIMITKMGTFNKNNFKIFTLIPLAVFLLLAVACVNGSKESNDNSNENVTLAVEAVKMNVVYLGVENPVIIAANGIDGNNLSVSIDNGIIKKDGDHYLITPARTETATIEIYSEGKKLGSKKFRVLNLPSPQTFLVFGNNNTSGGGEIDSKDLVSANGIKADIPDFLFDVDFRIVGFQVRVKHNGITVVEKSENETFTAKQRDLMKSLSSGQTIIIDEIRAIGPDGNTRLLHEIEFKIL